MAEAAAFSVASNILTTISKKAIEIGSSIWEARDELAKLRVTIETIQAVLLDAEKKQEGSAAVKNWIKRVKGVLHDAEDLLDLVATDDLLDRQKLEGDIKLSLIDQVRNSYINPIISKKSIAEEVEIIRKKLVDISTDMAQYQFVRCQNEEPIVNMRRGQDPGCFVDAKSVIGREEDKRVVLEMLIDESGIASSDPPAVIVIFGIGGMGKTTLAQLIYNDETVKTIFEKRWFVCISDISDEKEVLVKIFQSVCEGSFSDLNVSQLQTKIRETIEGKKYLLVLDDVWDDHLGRWQHRKSLLSGGAKGSRIIVTTRSNSVKSAMGTVRAHDLKGLSEDDSWCLFKRLAFIPGYERDPRREITGREILKKCWGVPLAIWSMGSLLHGRTIGEWEEIERDRLSMLERNENAEITSILRISYDHLPSKHKHCFAYCSLFPKDYRFNKQELIYLWKAQGYIESDEEEFSFMNLLRRGFFQEAKENDCGEIESCKMHDIMHDLAVYVAGKESIMLSGTSSNDDICPRHVSLVVDDERNESWSIPTSLLNVKSLRSCLLSCSSSQSSICCHTSNLDQLCSNFKMLRTLSLSVL